MSLLADAVLICGSIIKTAAAIQELGKEWYKPNQDWEEFTRKLGKLQIEHDIWKSQVHTYGMLSDGGLVDRLERARHLLHVEEKKIKEMQSRCGVRCWLPNSTLFPTKLVQILQTVLDDFADIPDTLSRHSNAVSIINSYSMHLPVIAHQYVALVKSESEVHQALEMKHPCPLVTVLHGGPGRGKSSLATEIALKYMEATSQTGVGVGVSSRFNQVVILECGPKADPVEKQLQLLHDLGGLGVSTREGEGRHTLHVSQLLRFMLKDRAILIILDDVWDSEFLRSFVVLGGGSVKFLVTTRIPTLWRNAYLVEIQDIDLFDARKILASHVGLEDKQIPQNLQDIADSMIAHTEKVPMALASMATAISIRRRTDRKEWKAAAKELFMTLETNQTPVLIVKYPRSFWATMRLSVKALSEGALELLVLTSLFQGPSIPEEVLQVVYSHYQRSKRRAIMFNRWRNELEDHGSMLRTRMQDLIPNSSSCAVDILRTTWCLHGLHKSFVLVEMKDRVRSLFEFMMRSDAPESRHKFMEPEPVCDHETLVLLLCALYLEEGYGQRAARRLGISCSVLTRKARRSAIEPVLYLLQDADEESEDWPFIRQIVVTYVCTGELYEEGFIRLLSERNKPQTTLLACYALESIALIERKYLINDSSEGILASLIMILEQGAIDIRERALRALVSFSLQPQNKSILLNFPGCVKEIVRRLSDYDHPTIQELAARTVANLASNGMDIEYGNLIMLECPRCVLELRKLLSEDDCPALQAHSARALANLAWNNVENQKKIFKSPGCVTELVRLLSKDDSPCVQEEAARVLGTLAWNKLSNGKVITAESPRCISQLVKLLFKDEHPFVQFTAAWALLNLIQNNVENQQNVLDSPGSVRALVKILCKNEASSIQFEENPSTVHHAAQQTVACILVTLAWNNAQMRKILLKSPECMTSLVTTLQGLDEWKLPISNRDNLAWNNVDHEETIAERQLVSLRQLSQLVAENNRLAIDFQTTQRRHWPPEAE